MPIPLDNLRSAAWRSVHTNMAKSLAEAKARQEQSAFLCHSHKDPDLALGLQVLLREQGWMLYIDGQNKDLPDNPSQETAQQIIGKIRKLERIPPLSLFHLVTS